MTPTQVMEAEALRYEASEIRGCKSVRHDYSFKTGWQACLAKDSRVLALVEALIFYADEREYVNIGVRKDLYDDRGTRAKEALAAFKNDIDSMSIDTDSISGETR